jgi:hypothetical protein
MTYFGEGGLVRFGPKIRAKSSRRTEDLRIDFFALPQLLLPAENIQSRLAKQNWQHKREEEIQDSGRRKHILPWLTLAVAPIARHGYSELESRSSTVQAPATLYTCPVIQTTSVPVLISLCIKAL